MSGTIRRKILGKHFQPPLTFKFLSLRCGKICFVSTHRSFSSSKNNIVRIVVPPSETANLIYQLSNKFKYYLDWGGALIWMEAFELSEEMFESIRRKVVKLGGYMTMIKNSDYLPYVEDVFTINRERFNISQSIKKSFDPKRILNPGKMYTGI